MQVTVITSQWGHVASRSLPGRGEERRPANASGLTVRTNIQREYRPSDIPIPRRIEILKIKICKSIGHHKG